MRRTVLALGALAVLASGCGGGLDAHGKAACDEVKRIDAGGTTGLIDGAVAEIKAVDEARKSTNTGLRQAAHESSAASSLDPSNPLYANPGDVQFNAVAAWCRQH